MSLDLRIGEVVAVPHERSDAHNGPDHVNRLKWQVIDVDEMFWPGEPQVHHRHEALAPGKRAAVFAELGKQVEGVLYAFSPVVLEGEGSHQRLRQSKVPGPGGPFPLSQTLT
jgi:hypothetical protein